MEKIRESITLEKNRKTEKPEDQKAQRKALSFLEMLQNKAKKILEIRKKDHRIKYIVVMKGSQKMIVKDVDRVRFWLKIAEQSTGYSLSTGLPPVVRIKKVVYD